MEQSSTLNRLDDREVPLNQWIPFLAEFTRQYRGAHARLEIIGPSTEIGYGVPTEDRPFDGVSADIKDRERTVWITFAFTSEDVFTHGIHEATVLRSLLPPGNTRPILEVEAADGTKTILELTSPDDYSLPPA
jgi:Family of unknown function (DUF5335)